MLWKFFKSELKECPFATLRTFIFGMGGWLFAVTFSSVVAVTTPQFWVAQAVIGIVMLFICTLITINDMKFKLRLSVLRGEVIKRAMERWDGNIQ